MFKGPYLKKQVNQNYSSLFLQIPSWCFTLCKSLQVYHRNCYFQCSKTHNSKSNQARHMVLKLYMPSYFALHFCKASRKSLKPFSSYKKSTSMTGITIYNVQREITPKAGNLELWFLCSTHHIMVIYICIVSSKYLKQFSSN